MQLIKYVVLKIPLSKADLFNSERNKVIKEIKNKIDSDIFVISSISNEGMEKLMENLFNSRNFIDD